jgi:hypothetical protein
MPRVQLNGERTHGARRGESSASDDGTGPSYGDWQRQELLQRAHELDIGGRTTMTKQQLIDALHDLESHEEGQRL